MNETPGKLGAGPPGKLGGIFIIDETEHIVIFDTDEKPPVFSVPSATLHYPGPSVPNDVEFTGTIGPDRLQLKFVDGSTITGAIEGSPVVAQPTKGLMHWEKSCKA